jgi:hypothetical protein
MARITDPYAVDYQPTEYSPPSDIPLWMQPINWFQDWLKEQERLRQEAAAREQMAAQAQAQARAQLPPPEDYWQTAGNEFVQNTMQTMGAAPRPEEMFNPMAASARVGNVLFDATNKFISKPASAMMNAPSYYKQGGEDLSQPMLWGSNFNNLMGQYNQWQDPTGRVDINEVNVPQGVPFIGGKNIIPAQKDYPIIGVKGASEMALDPFNVIPGGEIASKAKLPAAMMGAVDPWTAKMMSISTKGLSKEAQLLKSYVERTGKSLEDGIGYLKEYGFKDEPIAKGIQQLGGGIDEARAFVAKTTAPKPTPEVKPVESGTVPPEVPPVAAQTEMPLGTTVTPTPKPLGDTRDWGDLINTWVRTKRSNPNDVTPPPRVSRDTIDREPIKINDYTEAKFTPVEADERIQKIGQILSSPKVKRDRELTEQLRSVAIKDRFTRYRERANELVDSGLKPEEAWEQAKTEMLTGKLPYEKSTVFDYVTDDLRDALFSKVYHTLANDPIEQVSTLTALANALTGMPIPRTPGVKGGSALSRLLKVFGNDPEIMKILDNKKPLRKTLEDLYLGKDPQGVDKDIAEYLRAIGNKESEFLTPPAVQTKLPDMEQPWDIPEGIRDPRTRDERMLDYLFDTRKETPPMGEVPPEEPIANIVKQQLPGMPTVSQNMLVQALKYAGLTIGDIGNMIRAGMASGDFSFWRQQAPMIIGHPKRFGEANVKAFKAIFSEEAAKESWRKITQSSLYGLYEDLGLDFIRPAMDAKGIPEWRLVEEFGYSGANRPIPKLTEKIPWVKISQRSFTTGTNEHNWAMFNDFYQSRLKYAEEIASGARKLKPGESVDLRKDLKAYGKMLEDFSGRGSLGKAKVIASTLSGTLFAPRMVMGRIMTPRHLFSPSPAVRVEAWKNLSSFIAGIGGILVAGKLAGWWDVETDPRNANFAKIRVGDTRFDPWGGYQQYVTLASRILSGTGISSVTGEEYPMDPTSAIARAVESKAAPLLGIFSEMYTGKTFLGEKVNYADLKQWADRLGVPMSWMSIAESFQGNFGMGVASIIPSLVGVGVQTYSSPTSPTAIKQRMNESLGINLPPTQEKDTALETFQKQLTPTEYKTALEYYGTTYKERADVLIKSTTYRFLSDEDKKKALNKISSEAQKEMIKRYQKRPISQIKQEMKVAKQQAFTTIETNAWSMVDPQLKPIADYIAMLEKQSSPKVTALLMKYPAILNIRKQIALAKQQVGEQYTV